MKTTTITISIICLISLMLNAQEIQFEQHVITDTFIDGFDVSAADVDQDGYMDILGCGKESGGKVCWWQNNGDNTFTQVTLKQGFAGARSIRAKDINGDLEIDIVCAAWQANEIVYFENDGDENFTEIVVDDDFKGAHTLDLKDVNGDGYLDIMCSGFDYYGHNGEIAWWENDGQDSISWTKHLISDRFQQSPFIFGEDMDNDGDIDALACGELNNEILWWENDGSGQFISENMVDSLFYTAHTVIARDVDMDGDMDILGAGCMNSKLAWYENDGNQQFTKHSLAPLGGDLWLDAYDLDNDGDQDLIAAGMSASNLKWFENDGNQQFTKHNVDGGFASGFAIVPVNMDADGDIDLLAIGYSSDMISWFENDLDSTTSIGQHVFSPEKTISIFPNPCSDMLNINSGVQGEMKYISIYNSNGQMVRAFYSNDKNTWIWTGAYYKGIYFLKIMFLDGNISSSKFIKQ